MIIYVLIQVLNKIIALLNNKLIMTIAKLFKKKNMIFSFVDSNYSVKNDQTKKSNCNLALIIKFLYRT